jgi:phosphohistidine phosphatase
MRAPRELYLIRHGIAEERGPAWPDDTIRPLTEQGVSRLEKAARGLANLGIELDVVLTSPLVRTRQTADIVANAFDPPPPIVVIESLSPNGSRESLFSDLKKQARRRRIALVGHEPGLGELAAHLVAMRQPLAFKKGAVCRIDVEALPPKKPGALVWFATPGILRGLR